MQQLDYVDRLIEQWQLERPAVDTTPMGLIGRIRRLSRIIERHIEEGVFTVHALHGGRFDVLAALVRAGPPNRLTPTQLYNSLLISSGTITNRIDRLTEEGLVTRNADSRDGRSVPVQLTDAGRHRLDNALLDLVEIEMKLIDGLDPGDQDQLAHILRRWLLALGDWDHPVQAGEV